jgi:four helix bundle protein
MNFDAYTVSLEVIRALRKIMPKIQQRSSSSANQMERAASSIAQNLREGCRRVGKDRIHHWRIAAGSADEVRACLDVAEAWGWVGPSDISEALALVDRVLAMTWRMTH